MARNAEQLRQWASAQGKQRQWRERSLVANSRVQFANWLKENHPEVFSAALDFAERAKEQRLARQAGVFDTGLGQWEGWTDPWVAAPTAQVTDTRSFWEKFTEGAIAAGTTYLTLKNQRDAMKINLERAQLGQPPIDIATSAPVIRTQIEIDPALARDLASNVGSSINRNMLIFGGLAIAALIFFGMRK